MIIRRKALLIRRKALLIRRKALLIRRKALLILVLLIGLILRFYQLTTVPPALDWDEVSNAYNGYSILQTGRDEFGQTFPILFRAYDGYVPPILVYLNSISIGIFGLNELGARIPNAILGTLTVWGVYLLVRKLHPGGEQKVALLSALFLAISPWHILYSRVNTFALTPLFFVVFGAYFFLLAVEKQRLLILPTVFFVLAIFSYFSAYIFVPLFALALAVIYRKKLSPKSLFLMLASLFFATVLILFVLTGGQNRLQGVTIFSDSDLVKTAALEAENEGFIGRVLHNRRFVYAQETLKGYFSYFKGDFLFGRGDAVSRMVIGASGSGLLFLWFLPFLIAGVFHLVSEKPKGWTIWIFWLLLAPAAAATSLPQPTSTRTTLMIPPLVVITAYGFSVILNRFDSLTVNSAKNLSLRFFGLRPQNDVVRGILILLLVFNLLIFLHHYFVHFPYEKSREWFFGYRQLFNLLNSGENADKRVHFVYGQPDPLDQIHMFLLFYNRIDPSLWQANGGTRLGCIGTTGQFSFQRYDFIPYSCLTKPVDWKSFGENDMIVTSKLINGSYVDKVEYLDGKDAFYIYQYRDVSPVILDTRSGRVQALIENPDSRFPRVYPEGSP